MTITLILVLAVAPIMAYGFWLAGELGVGPRLGRSRRAKPAQLDAEPEGGRVRKAGAQ
jgi:hypothetical protein